MYKEIRKRNYLNIRTQILCGLLHYALRISGYTEMSGGKTEALQNRRYMKGNGSEIIEGLPRHLPKGLAKFTRNLSQVSRCPRGDSKGDPLHRSAQSILQIRLRKHAMSVTFEPVSSTKRHRLSVVFKRGQARISARTVNILSLVFRTFPQSLQINSRTVLQTTRRQLLSTSSLIRHLIITTEFSSTYSELQTASLNEP
jgi:hypothetical protein